MRFCVRLCSHAACQHDDCVELGMNGLCDVSTLTHTLTLTSLSSHSTLHTHHTLTLLSTLTLTSLSSHSTLHTHLTHLPQMKCFTEACGFDGGQRFCLPNTTNSDPWEDCPKSDLCRELLNNGVCDPNCNTRQCLFDSYECVPQLECPSNLV